MARAALQLRTVANHRSAPPAPAPAAKNSAAFRNAAAPHRWNLPPFSVARITRQLRTLDGSHDPKLTSG